MKVTAEVTLTRPCLDVAEQKPSVQFAPGEHTMQQSHRIAFREAFVKLWWLQFLVCCHRSVVTVSPGRVARAAEEVW